MAAPLPGPAPAPAPAPTVTDVAPAVLALRAAFDRVPGYLDTATSGLPARASLEAMRDSLDAWSQGRIDMAFYDESVTRARTAFARVVGVPPSWVAIGGSASPLVGIVAAGVRDGGRVVVVDGDFTSVVFPFLVHEDRGVVVEHVPLERLAESVRPGVDVVAFSLVQSRDGRVADVEAITAAAERVGALTLCDATQAAGWLPFDAGRFDVTVVAAYKWLAAPRGTAFLVARPEAVERMRPLHACWYAGEKIWGSVYGPHMRLADDARRFDSSPSWLCWAGAAPALEALASVDLGQVHAHDVGLADAFCDAVGRPRAGSAIVSLPDDDEGTLRTRLLDAGLRVAGRGGGVRLAFHHGNGTDDVARAAAAVTG